MSRDYDKCDKCDYGMDTECLIYCDCGNKFCNVKCGKIENYKAEEDYTDDDEDDEATYHRIDKSKPITCSICRREYCTDYILLNWMLKHFNLTKTEAKKLWKKEE